MSESLITALRPKRLSDVVGYPKIIAALRKQMTSKNPPRAVSFIGGPGTGKTTIMKIVSVAVQCGHQQVWGDPCAECWEKYNQFSIHDFNASDDSGVNEIRPIAELSRQRPFMGSNKRVIVLNEAQRISKDAQNLLLDFTENPPMTTLWGICTTDYDKILPALQQRFYPFKLPGLPYGEVGSFLADSAKKAKLTVNPKLLAEAAIDAGINSPRLLLRALDQFSAGMSVHEAITGVDAESIDTKAICQAVIGGKLEEFITLSATVTKDNARYIRASVSGYIKGCIKRAGGPQEMVRHGESLILLNALAPFEEAVLANWLIGVLIQVTAKYARK